MEDRKKRNATNDNINLQADTLIDLPLTDEQAEEAKAGDGTRSFFAFEQGFRGGVTVAS